MILFHTILQQALLRRERELLPQFTKHHIKRETLSRWVHCGLQREWKQIFAGVTLLMALGQTPALAATINVGGGCTLVNAITAANTDTATGGCAAGFGADTVVLPQRSTQTLTVVNNTADDRNPNGLPVIRSTITIQGNGATIRRTSTAPFFRIFSVASGARLTLQQITITGGRAGYGGGVTNFGIITLIHSTISGNSTLGGGGGGLANYGTATVSSSTISGNGGSHGGGIFSRGPLTIINSTVSDNSALFGGGVFNTEIGTVTLTNSTVTRNSAADWGGGVLNGGASLTLNHALISGNTAPSGSEVLNDPSSGIVTAGKFNLFGFNGNAGVSGFRPSASDIVPRVALGAILNSNLANNGGFTKTHALVTGSPAIDAVTDGTCPPPNTDQRGVTRPQDGNGDTGAACDIGSFELGGGTAPPPAKERVPIVFIHGFRGDPTSFGRMPSLLKTDADLAFDYSNFTDFNADVPIQQLAGSFGHHVKGVIEDHRSQGVSQVDVVAHSMGGLVARAWIAGMSSPLKIPYGGEIRKLVLIATPNYGANPRNLDKLCSPALGGCSQLKQLKFGSKFVWTLHDRWTKSTVTKPDVLYIVGTQSRNIRFECNDLHGCNDGIVDISSAVLPDSPAARVRYVPYRHSAFALPRGGPTIAGVTNVQHATYRLVREFLKNGRVLKQCCFARTVNYNPPHIRGTRIRVLKKTREGLILIRLLNASGQPVDRVPLLRTLIPRIFAGSHANQDGSSLTFLGVDAPRKYNITVGGHFGLVFGRGVLQDVQASTARPTVESLILKRRRR